MTIEDPKTSDVSTAPPTKKPLQPNVESVRLKGVGEGQQAADNPFDNWLPSYDEETYNNEAKAAENKTVQAAQAARTGQAKSTTKAQPKTTTNSRAQQLINRAKSFVGTPYKWGGNGPLGFDCSGFTQYLFKELGINLPRVSYQQGNLGAHIGIKELKPGDLVFWDNSSRNAGADHVAVYIGNGQVIHAPKPGDRVKISTIWDGAHAWGVSMNL